MPPEIVGAALKLRVFCLGELADRSAGHPDFGLYSAKRVQKRRLREGQTPERGVVEVKPADDDAWRTAFGEQLSRYLRRYRLVLVTDARDFVLVGEDALGRPAKPEILRLADGAEDFERRLEKPRAFAREAGAARASARWRERVRGCLEMAVRSRNRPPGAGNVSPARAWRPRKARSPFRQSRLQAREETLDAPASSPACAARARNIPGSASFQPACPPLFQVSPRA